MSINTELTKDEMINYNSNSKSRPLTSVSRHNESCIFSTHNRVRTDCHIFHHYSIICMFVCTTNRSTSVNSQEVRSKNLTRLKCEKKVSGQKFLVTLFFTMILRMIVGWDNSMVGHWVYTKWFKTSNPCPWSTLFNNPPLQDQHLMKTTPVCDLITAMSFYTAAPMYIPTILAEDRDLTQKEQ